MSQKIVTKGGLTYHWNGAEPLQVDDIVEVPALPWASESTSWVTVAETTSDYEGSTKNVIAKVRGALPPVLPHEHSPILQSAEYTESGKQVVLWISRGCLGEIELDQWGERRCAENSLTIVDAFLSNYGASRLRSYGWGGGTGDVYVYVSAKSLRTALAEGIPTGDTFKITTE